MWKGYKSASLTLHKRTKTKPRWNYQDDLLHEMESKYMFQWGNELKILGWLNTVL